jgi:hypothetical protein
MRTVKVITEAECDICSHAFDGDETPTIEFEWSGQRYEIDLCPPSIGDHFNTSTMREFVDCARPVKKKPTKKRTRSKDMPEDALPFKCEFDDCPSKGFVTARGLSRHMSVAHKDEYEGAPFDAVMKEMDDGTGRYECQPHGTHFKSRKSAMVHFNTFHGKDD